MTVTIEIKGMEAIQRKLRDLQPREYAIGTMQASVALLKNEIAPYPPATAANSPMARRWYERGYGNRWLRRDGSIGGKRTSQTLGRRWTTKVEQQGMRGVVGNNVTYGPFVQSAARQTWYHKRTGWRTDEQAIQRVGPKIRDLWSRAIAKILAM